MSNNKKVANELRALIEKKQLYSDEEYNAKLLELRNQLQNMSSWIDDLKNIDDISNHHKKFEIVLEAFLTSDYANGLKLRTGVITLFNHLKKLE